MCAAGTIADYAGNGNGATALYIATQNGEFACVRELVQAGVSLDPQMESCGSTPLMCATFIAQVCDLPRSPALITPLITSLIAPIPHAYSSRLFLTPLLPPILTPLACVCATWMEQRDDDKPHRDILELLLQSGANIEVKNKAGLSAIDLAKDDNSIIKLINDEKDRRKKGGGSFLN